MTGLPPQGPQFTQTQDAVLNSESRTLFVGTSEETVKWLNENPSKEMRWVYVSRSNCIMLAEEYQYTRS